MSKTDVRTGYQQDLSPRETYARLINRPDAILIDVRTEAEWDYVGWPAVDQLVNVAWQHYPEMTPNGEFVKEVEEIDPTKQKEIYLICRSGVRSAEAASALSRAGFTRCYNVAEGFEGDIDNDGHRSMIGGWKRAGLPWRQD